MLLIIVTSASGTCLVSQLVDIKGLRASANMTRSHLLDSNLDQITVPKLKIVISEGKKLDLVDMILIVSSIVGEGQSET